MNNLTALDIVKLQEALDDINDIKPMMVGADCIHFLRFLEAVLVERLLFCQVILEGKEDLNKVKFWNFPRCTCPSMDNEDMFGTGYSVRSSDCPLHGE